MAGTSNLSVDVRSALTPPPLPDKVSPSATTCALAPVAGKAGCTTAAYSVGISNPTSSNVSNAYFHATTYVVDANDQPTAYKAEFLTAPGCSISANLTTISCQIGQVSAGASVAPFIVTVHSPAVTTTDYKIKLVWDIPSGQGASGSLAPVSSSSAQSQSSYTTISDPPTPKKATTRSWVTTAGELYTGNAEIATAANLGTVKVILPKAPDTNVATITTEVTEETFCTTADFPNCIRFTLDIPGEFEDGTIAGYLTFVLQRDTTTIKKGARVENVVLYYQSSDLDPLLPIPDCDPLTGLLPAPALGYDDSHCIALREAYPNNAGKDLKGDFKITVRGKSNGRIGW
jgi:hypothetical protein